MGLTQHVRSVAKKTGFRLKATVVENVRNMVTRQGVRTRGRGPGRPQGPGRVVDRAAVMVARVMVRVMAVLEVRRGLVMVMVGPVVREVMVGPVVREAMVAARQTEHRVVAPACPEEINNRSKEMLVFKRRGIVSKTGVNGRSTAAVTARGVVARCPVIEDVQGHLELLLMTVEILNAYSTPKFIPALAVKTPERNPLDVAMINTQLHTRVARLVIIGECITEGVVKI